ncbi:MAG: nicotinamidase [Spirochaeta sp. LUC14_002_19_P3]|nr:MAG: nicotinamidase [Spirochaeta sp. LUC14_002_19_P3]
MDALIIIDVQNDFCTGGALAVPGSEEVVPRINAVSSNFALTAATQDWHPPGHISFASAHGETPGKTIGLPSGPQMLWPDHCVQGSPGADFHPELNLKPVSLIIRKGTRPKMDSYSAFLENDHSTSTGLAACLKSLGVTKVFLCGLATDYCVYFSAMDAVAAGFETAVIENAVRGVNIPEGSITAAVETMKKNSIQFVKL